MILLLSIALCQIYCYNTNMDTFEIYQMLSLSIYLMIKEKRIFRVYYYPTPISCSNYFNSKIAKASDFNIH